MSSSKTIRNRRGFTLIEVLVTLILLAVLAAAVFPIVTQQSDQGDPVRVASDLGSIRSAVEQFRLDVRPNWPGDLEDLAFVPDTTGTTDPDLNRNKIGNFAKWNGPYIDAALTAGATALDTTTAFTTAFGGEVKSDLVCLSAGVTPVDLSTTDCAAGNAIAVEIRNIDVTEAKDLEELIDGGNGATVNTTGKFRHDGTATPAATTAYYVVGTYF
jgi:prepilin-type N-terminal cleavage/methylation domain-containing protein